MSAELCKDVHELRHQSRGWRAITYAAELRRGFPEDKPCQERGVGAHFANKKVGAGRTS